jgi:long-chain fatty acid transport protein
MRKPAPDSCRTSLLVGCLAICLTLTAVPLGADDFGFHDLGARAAALGGAFTGKADDITSIYYNPAGLAFLRGFRLKTDLVFASRTISATWPETGATFKSSPHELLGNHAIAWQPVKRISLGLGFFSPYSFDSQWPGTWIGEDVSIVGKLKTHYFRSTLAIQVLKGLAIGAGLDVVTISVQWDHIIPFEPGNYSLPHETAAFSRQELSGNGLGFTAGILWKVFPALQVGVKYQKSVAVELAGKNAFRFPLSYSYETVSDPYWGNRDLSSLLNLFYVPQDVTGKLTLPREVACGIALTPVPRLSLYLDVQWDKWSEFGSWEFRSVNTDEDLSPEFTTVYQEFFGIAPNYGTQGAALTFRDSRKLKAGLEFRPGRWFALRAGFARHQSSVEAADRSPLYPDLGLNVYSLGAGYEGPIFSTWYKAEAIGKLSFDLFIRYSSAATSTSALPGLELTYGAKRWTAGVGVGFTF